MGVSYMHDRVYFHQSLNFLRSSILDLQTSEHEEQRDEWHHSDGIIMMAKHQQQKKKLSVF